MSPFALFLLVQHILQWWRWSARVISGLEMRPRENEPRLGSPLLCCEAGWAPSSILRVIKGSHILAIYWSMCQLGLIWNRVCVLCVCNKLQCLRGMYHASNNIQGCWLGNVTGTVFPCAYLWDFTRVLSHWPSRWKEIIQQTINQSVLHMFSAVILNNTYSMSCHFSLI